MWVYYTIPFGLSLFRHFWGIIFHIFELLCLAKDNWRGFSTRIQKETSTQMDAPCYGGI